MFCIKCGTQLPEDANFCSKCGQPVQRQRQNVATSFENSGQFKPALPIIGPDSVKFCAGRKKFQKLSTGEKLALVQDKETKLIGVINDMYEVVIPLIFYHNVDSDLERLSENTRGQRPNFCMDPTLECSGWGRIFINRDLDVEFDRKTQEEFYEQYPTGRKWFQEHIDELGQVYGVGPINPF